MQKNDFIVLYTDGIIDQFGGEKGKKLKSKMFKQYILELVTYPVEEYESRLEVFMNDWKGNLSQTDDICVIGIKV